MYRNLLSILSFLLLISACKSVSIPIKDDGTAIFYTVQQKPFYHGVASGDPLADRVIIWTRVTPMNEQEVKVKWIIATDNTFNEPVKTGVVRTDASKDYTVKVDVIGLNPNTIYYFQFEALSGKSVVGRTKTAAKNGQSPVRLAFVSCSNYEAGYYNAFARIAERDDLDAVVHLGDYIYEYEPNRYGDESLDRKHLPAKEITTLADYRTRYAQYRLDSDFQKVHQMHPFITIWDDHEIANNAYKEGAENHQAEEGSFKNRKAAAKQAYFEWLPVRDNTSRDIYRTIRFGEMVDLIMLDERIKGRTYPVDSVEQAEFAAASRSMLGREQLNWFKNELQNAKAVWKIIGNQVIFSPLDISGLGWGSTMNLDAWDGYPYERSQICQFIEHNNIENIIITAGDTHSSWAFEVPSEKSDKVIAVEVGTPSITSSNSDESNPLEKVIKAEQAILTKNPHLKFTDLRNHGYLLLSLTNSEATAEWYYVDRIDEPASGETMSKRFVVKSKTNKLKKQ